MCVIDALHAGFPPGREFDFATKIFLYDEDGRRVGERAFDANGVEIPPPYHPRLAVKDPHWVARHLLVSTRGRRRGHPSVEYAYTVNPNGLNAVQTGTLGADGIRQNTTVVLYDGLGRPFQQQTDAANSTAAQPTRMVSHVFYDSAGRMFKQISPWQATGAPGMAGRGFLGAPADPTGLTLLGARYYDPGTGTFVSVDPELSSDVPAQFNAYVYAGNNPVTWADPSGWNWFADVWKKATKFVKKHQAEIGGFVAGALVTAGCMAATAGAGSVGCFIAGGAVAGAVTNVWKQAQSKKKFQRRQLRQRHLVGGALGALGPAVRALGRVVAPVASRMVGALAGALKPAAAKIASAFKPVAVAASRPAAATRPAVTGAWSVSVAAEPRAFLYRGVPHGHPGSEDAARGIARPRGGHSSPDRHNGGDTNSVFTSWTKDESIARDIAAEGNGPGIVLRIPRAESSGRTLVSSPDVYGEEEVLVRGLVTGADVLPWRPVG